MGGRCSAERNFSWRSAFGTTAGRLEISNREAASLPGELSCCCCCPVPPQYLVGECGFDDVKNVQGGIHEYSSVDPSVPVY